MKQKAIPHLPEHLPPLTDDEGDVRELTAADFAHFRPMNEVFPDIVDAFERMRGERGPQVAPVKERIGLRLDSAVVAHFRATGAGWQSRINDILKQHLAAHDGEGQKK